MSRRLGLIIGVNQYQDPTFQPLHYAETDALALAKWLANDRGGKWPSSDVQFISGSQVTRETVEKQLTQLCLQNAAPGDLIVIYFAGHAFLDERNADGYLALSNTNYQDPRTALHLLSFVHFVTSQSPASQILVVLDCFQTGQQWSKRRSTPFDFRPLFNQQLQTTLQQQTDRVFLCTCRGNEYLPEASERNLGTFTYRTIVGLCGPAADPATGNMTLRNLQTYLADSLGGQHTLQLFGQQQSEFFLTGDTTSPRFSPSSYALPELPMQSSGLPRTTGQPYQLQNLTGSGAMQATGSSPAYATATAQLMPQIPQTPALGSQPLGAARPKGHTVNQSSLNPQKAQLEERVQYYLQNQNYTEALTAIDHILSIDPGDTESLIRKGQILGTMGRFQEAFSVVQQLTQLDANNPVVWSMQAVLLSNMGQFKAALDAIEHSLELDAKNTETFAIKNNIMEQMAVVQSQQSELGMNPSIPYSGKKKRGGPLSFLATVGLHLLGLLLGIGGLLLPLLSIGGPVTLPLRPEQLTYIGLGLASVGMALLCVNATRSAYLFGFLRLLFFLLVAILIGVGFIAAYKVDYLRIIDTIKNRPTLLQPGIFLTGWLIAAATLPLLLAIGSFFVGLIRGVRKHS